MIFDIEVSISERFPSLNPIEIRKTRASEIFLLIKRLGRKNRRETKKKNKKQNITRRPAGDNWF